MNLCKLFSLFLFLLLSFSALSQHSSQPTKESTDDLRDGTVMFVVHNLDEGSEIWLERTANLDYFLRSKAGDEEKIVKLSAREAKKLDMEFASKFLKCQYELPASPSGCEVTLKLNLKGDVQEICGKEEKKNQEIVPLVKEIQKRF